MEVDKIAQTMLLGDGNRVVLIDRLGITGHEERARNIYRIDVDGTVRWQIRTAHDGEGDPFTHLHFTDEVLTAYRWDGGSYRIDLETGFAVPERLEK